MSIIENIFNPNDHFTWGNAFNNTYRGNNSGSPSIKQGVIVNVSRQNHLAQTYDVEELESGALLKGCKYISDMGSFNGTGTFYPLEEGTPVTLSCANGMWDEVFITGVFFTEGNYDSYYQEGKLQKPGDTENNLEFNQVSGHPNRIVDPTAHLTIYGNKNLTGEFASPEFTNDTDSKTKANPLPGIIELRDTVGNIVNYSSGNNITYTEQNVITVSGGTNETKCNKLLEIANYYNSYANLLEGTNKVTETSKQQAQATTGIKPIVTASNPVNNNSTLRSPFEQSYFIQQYRKLAELHIQQAQKCNSLDAARQNVVNQMETTLGSELPSTNNSSATEGKITKPNYTPKESKSAVDPNNFGDRIPNKFKPLIVLHETIGNANTVITLFQNPKAEVSYHVMIKLDGSLVNFTDSKKRAYGASPSQFNGEFETRTRTDGKTVKSVNSFAYHISFETPLDGQTPNEENPTHSGYTEAQYMSAAYQCAKCGVPLERITTHKEIDLVPFPKNKKDPRSFDKAKFEKLFNSFPKTKEIFFDIPGEEDWIKTQGTNTESVTQTTSDALYKEADKLVTVENGVKLHPDAAEFYRLLKQAAAREGVNIKLVSGFRSIAAQQKIIDNKRKTGQTDAQIFKVNTKAGYSEHHTGYAFDIDDVNNPANLSESFDKTKAYAFMVNNAKKYGFELSYPKGNTTGINYEPWHWRFIGTNTAKAALNITETTSPLNQNNNILINSSYPVINEAGNTVFTTSTEKVFKLVTTSPSGNIVTNFSDLKSQVSEVLNYFNSVSDAKVTRKGLLNVDIATVQQTLKKVQSISNLNLDTLKSNFNFYKWAPYNLSNQNQSKIKITKYAVFTHNASKVKTSTYNVGIYELKSGYTNYTKYTKQQVLSGVYETGGAEFGKVQILGYTTLDDLNEMLLEGAGYIKFTDGEETYINVTKSNEIPYDKKKTPAAQSRYWYFKKVNSPKGYGSDISNKINIKPNVTFAGDYLNVGFGKLILLESNGTLRLATIGDTGGAFLPSLYQLDYFAGTFANKTAYNNFVANLPSEANAYVLISK